LPAADITFTIPGHSFSVDDRIVCHAVSGSTLPTGVTEGTIYWVKTVSGNDITISTTQGGATLDVTVAGDGIAFSKMCRWQSPTASRHRPQSAHSRQHSHNQSKIMADGLFYWDTREPFMGSSSHVGYFIHHGQRRFIRRQTFQCLGGQYFARVGKLFCIRVVWRTDDRRHSGKFNVGYLLRHRCRCQRHHSGIIGSTCSDSKPDQRIRAWVDVFVRCVTIGSAGTLFVWGDVIYNEGVVAAKQMIPASAPAVSSGVDLTAANIISVQLKRSGSTAETFTTWARLFQSSCS
jgi:hypothetical protein